MTQQRQSFGPGKVLAQVTLIVALPLVGGVIAGLVADGALGTSPLFVLSGLVIGTLVTAVWLRWFITTNMSRLRREEPAVGPGAEQHEQSTTERT
ncbi:MAG TPA: AtpZ/AtpI family protein [Candidatus Limnocylindria bacterium]